MSVNYAPVLWNRQKRIYDRVMLSLVAGYLAVFIALQMIAFPEITAETLIIRATGTLAFLMLHVILCIGPLARIDSRFLPLLYNRRHLGVTMCCMALIHGIFNIVQFHALGNVDPLVSLFTSNPNYALFGGFPFEVFGFLALVILLLMASTSHDFWLKNLSPKVWKTLHMMVYWAYAMLVLHVMLGVVQLEKSPVLIGMMGLGVITVTGLHVYGAILNKKQTQEVGPRHNHSGPAEQSEKAEKTVKAEKTGIGGKVGRSTSSGTGPSTSSGTGEDGEMGEDGPSTSSGTVEGGKYYKVCRVGDIAENRAKTVMINGENIAIFKYDNKLSAINNLCRHQNGPLGEGKIMDGCVTCPWHGYQYLPHNGQSPPPFTEKVETYDVKLEGEWVYVNPAPYPEGTERPPCRIDHIVNRLNAIADEVANER